MDLNKYRHLRDIVLCRLALFNARRGGEMAALTVEELGRKIVDTADPCLDLSEMEQRLILR